MPAPEQTNSNVEILGLLSSALSSFWAWLLPMIAGIFHLGKMGQKVSIMEQQTSAIMDIKLDVKELKTKMDILLKDK